MPGIIGCLKSSGTSNEVQDARQKLKYASFYKDDQIFEDDCIICTRTHLNTIGEKNTPIETNENICWIEGEFYNIAELKNRFKLIAETEGAILLEANEKNILKEVLNSIDGLYAAVIYSHKESSLSFITDRFGLKPFYIWNSPKQLAWCSELKGFLSFNQFPKMINEKGLLCFHEIGHFIGNTTWFKDVFQQGASSLLVYSIKETRIVENIRYWSWESIKQVDLPFKEAINQLEFLFKKAVLKRCFPMDEKYGLSLSGGLDSRAILAAFPQDLPFLKTFTFGKKGCEDVKFAKEVSNIAGVKHQIFELHSNNWFNQRMEAIWKSDGSINLIHFHASQFHDQMSKLCKIAFNGFAGDLILGGSWLDNPNKRISSEKAALKFPSFSYLDSTNDSFYNINKEDPYYINNRVRRFTASGLNEIKYFENRIPFFDNELIEFIYSLPDEYRNRNKIYFALLLQRFPEYFKNTPKQGLGFPIYYSLTWDYYLKIIFRSFLNKVGYKPNQFADYKKWIKGVQPLFEKILKSNDAIFPNYLKENEVKEVNYYSDIQKIGNLITLEIWLQQVFNNRYFTTAELLESVV